MIPFARRGAILPLILPGSTAVWWPYKGSGRDYVGGRDIVLPDPNGSNCPVFSATGLTFDVDDYATMAIAAFPSAFPLTMYAIWTPVAAGTTTLPVRANIIADANTGYHLVNNSSSKLAARIVGETTLSDPGAAITSGKAYMATVTCDSTAGASSLKLYREGTTTPVASAADVAYVAPQTITMNAKFTTAGGYTLQAAQTVHCVGFVNRVIAAAEVASLYAWARAAMPNLNWP